MIESWVHSVSTCMSDQCCLNWLGTIYCAVCLMSQSPACSATAPVKLPCGCGLLASSIRPWPCWMLRNDTVKPGLQWETGHTAHHKPKPRFTKLKRHTSLCTVHTWTCPLLPVLYQISLPVWSEPVWSEDKQCSLSCFARATISWPQSLCYVCQPSLIQDAERGWRCQVHLVGQQGGSARHICSDTVIL